MLNADHLVCFSGAWTPALSPDVKPRRAARDQSRVLCFESFLERAQRFGTRSSVNTRGDYR
jgi:hypothetical protein